MAMPTTQERVDKHVYAHLLSWQTKRDIADYIDLFNSVMPQPQQFTNEELTLLMDYEVARLSNFNRDFSKLG